MLLQFADIILHLDKYLQTIASEYSALTYILLFLIIFLETGIVVTPFLPGDTLLFAAGTLAATGVFRIEILFHNFIAAVVGDALNYHIGKYVKFKNIQKESSLLFNKEHLARAKNSTNSTAKKQ